MALTYEQSGELMKDLVFRDRIKVSGIKFASYVFNEDPNAPGHASRYRWGQTYVMQPDMGAMQLQPMVVMDPAVQADGASISDAALQTAVEGVINKVA